MIRTARYSKKREAILTALCSTTTHPTAEWVYQTLKPTQPDLSLATVYRNLNLFREQGMIQSVGVVNGRERFDGNAAPHCHFICQTCGAVLDLPEFPMKKELDQVVNEQYGLRVDHHELVFHGVCSQCCAAEAEAQN